MVNPLEAKQMAVKQMQEIQAKERSNVSLKIQKKKNFFEIILYVFFYDGLLFQKLRRIEAINGAWAVIGLMVGLVIESRTGNSIPQQVSLISI